ncbi:MAG: alpha/beta hydrolase [Planctomycetota bacterium]
MERILVKNANWLGTAIGLILGLLVGIQCSNAQSDSTEKSNSDTVPNSSIPFQIKTLGGTQFWTDIRHCGGWRVQENTVIGYHRLLDPKNRLHQFGNLEQCLETLNEKRNSGDAVPHQGRVVIVLHGLIRTTRSMQKLGEYLAANSDMNAVNFEYASTRKPVAYHANALAQLIDSLGNDVTEINFVAHSMGNIVTRHFLKDLEDAGRSDSRFKRMVMIGPPNQGSKMAYLLKRSFFFNAIAGSSGWELGGGWEKLEPCLKTPDFEFGIIAGGQNDHQLLSNFMLPGKDDFTVTVDETKLVGATDFLVKPLLHGTMMRNQLTLDATLQFLEKGYFDSAESRNPIVELSAANQKND